MEKYQDQSCGFEERAADLVSRMTLEEKISQTVFTAAAIDRLGVPAYNYWNEALHGVARAGVATMFPQAVGMAASFDEGLLKHVGEVIAHEGRAKYNANSKYNDRGIFKGLTFWSPNVNIFRDPRWGRGHETYGEDPYLTSRLGVGFIEGIQGDHPKYLKAAACAKHFAVHSGPEALRHEFNAEVSEKELRETYLPAFKACVQEAKVEAVMGAYNRTNGEPCCGSDKLLVQILRDEWGFDGHVTSDCWAIKDFHEFHHVTHTVAESVALAMNKGCDLNCGHLFLLLNQAVNEGLITEDVITKSVTRLIVTRMRLGMFDNPEDVPFNSISYLENDTPESNAFAEEVSRRSLVLLKNDGILPLKPEEIKTIAVIGPNADSRDALIGNYHGTASQYITVLDGIREALPHARILYAEGCHLYKETDSVLEKIPGDRMAEAIEAAKLADVAIVALGLDENLEGEEGDASNAFASGDKRDLCFPGLQSKLLEAVTETGTQVILVNITGSSMDLREADASCKAIVQAFYPGARGGRSVASLLFGEYSPSGKLPVTFYKTGEELPDITDYSMRSGQGRTYRFMKNEPLYPFAYGLNYTSFEYSDIKAAKAGDNFIVTAKVKNIGKIKGNESSLLFVSHGDKTLDVPNWSLKGINNNEIQPGETAELSFTLTKSDLSVFDDEGKEVYAPGKIDIYVGGGQPDNRSFALTGAKPLRITVE
ncbi:MAG: glycoside hydrolase family 3 C-terminal domain-containing protein [Clostridiales bacterium]|jgi:beta-glucosidase|nr:glycoside hydrolase family 3 C-terminal domain-containing protein [Clostridiales bacterium]